MGVEGVEVPGTHPAYSTGRVLTMDRLTGAPIDQFLERADDETRLRAGERLVRVFYEMAFRLRTLHADPHAGNYLFRPDGTVGLLDFGCVKRFDPYWMGRYCNMALAILDDEPEVAVRVALCDALAGTEDEAARGRLARVARDEDESLDVRAAATRALRASTGF